MRDPRILYIVLQTLISNKIAKNSLEFCTQRFAVCLIPMNIDSSTMTVTKRALLICTSMLRDVCVISVNDLAFVHNFEVR